MSYECRLLCGCNILICRDIDKIAEKEASTMPIQQKSYLSLNNVRNKKW